MITPGQKYLITTDRWFIAPDGEQYSATFGTVHAVVDAEGVLGIRTNRGSTNWYVAIGDMIIAGCQIHYAMRSDKVSFEPPTCENAHEGQNVISKRGMTNIYNADATGLQAYA